MRPLSQATARYMILMVAGVYIVLFGIVEGVRLAGLLDASATAEVLGQLTTLGSLAVGAIIGFHLASRRRES